MAQPHMLNLDRGLSNNAFGSWRLRPDENIKLSRHSLPGRVQPVPSSGSGFLHTKTVVTHNHLHEQPSGTYVFLQPQSGQEQLALHRLEYKDAASGVAMHRLADAPDGRTEADANGGLLEPRLPPSVTTVRGASSSGPPFLLLSSGHGDLSLLVEGSTGGVSPPICPLREPPLQGVRTFLIEAAYKCAVVINVTVLLLEAGGELRCIVSALRGRRSSVPAACDMYAITLQPPPASSAEPLGVADVQLLQTSAARPHAVVVSPQQDSVLLAVDPAVPVGAHTQHGVLGTAEGEGCRAAAVAEEPPEVVDANPRSLQQAVENLARFTSEEPAKGLISERIADIDNETGPEGEGALGAEPDVALVLMSLSPPAEGPSSAGKSSAPTEIDRIACGTHRLLGISGGGGTREDGSGDSVLLGLTDDVDAAVVRISVGDHGLTEAKDVASVPALAYVAAGKVQRRAVLFGQPGAHVAAVITEAHAYVYVYKAVPPQGTTGSNAIVQLGLGSESLGTLGACLAGTAGGHSRLTLITEDAVLVVSM